MTYLATFRGLECKQNLIQHIEADAALVWSCFYRWELINEASTLNLMQAKQQSFVTGEQEVNKESNPRTRFEISPASIGVEADAASYSAANVATRIIRFRNWWLLHGYPENQLCKLQTLEVCLHVLSHTHTDTRVHIYKRLLQRNARIFTA